MKNYIYKLAGEGGVRILSTVFLLVLARIVGASEFGVYASAFAFATVFSLLVDLGTNQIVMREIARYPHKRQQIISSVNFLKTLTALVMFIILWLASQVVPFPFEKARLIPWFGIVAIGTAFTEYLSAIFTGMEQMKREAVLKILSKGVVMIAALITVLLTRQVYPTVRVMGLFSMVSMGIGVLFIRQRMGTFGFHYDAPYLRALLRQSLPIFGAVSFFMMYDSQDILILNYFKIPDAQIGIFALAIKIIDVLKVFPVLLANTYFPSLARHAQASEAEFMTRSRHLIGSAAIVFPATAILLYIFAPFLLKTLYGQMYSEAVPALRLLLIGFLFMAFNLVLLQLLIALDKEKQFFAGSTLLCLTNLTISIILVPRVGIVGACYALIGGEAVYLIFHLLLLKSSYPSLINRMTQHASTPTS